MLQRCHAAQRVAVIAAAAAAAAAAGRRDGEAADVDQAERSLWPQFRPEMVKASGEGLN